MRTQADALICFPPQQQVSKAKPDYERINRLATTGIHVPELAQHHSMLIPCQAATLRLRAKLDWFTF